MRNEFRLAIFKILAFTAMFTFSLAMFAQENGIQEKSIPKEMIVLNHSQLPQILKEFRDGCRYYHVDFFEKYHELESIKLVPGHYGFLGRVVGNKIEINQELGQYPNLLRVVTLRQLGKFFGIKELDSGMEIMSPRWQISLEYEIYARRHRERPWQRLKYFQALAEELPLEREL